MACAVPEIALRFPKRHAGNRVYLTSGRSAREHRHREVDHALEHERIVLFLQEGAFTHGNSPGYVGRTCQILSARIHKVKAARTDHRRAFARSRIVRQGRCRTICGYVLETVASVSGHLGTELGQLLGSLPFGHFPSGRDLLVQPVQETLHGHTVIYECLP